MALGRKKPGPVPAVLGAEGTSQRPEPGRRPPSVTDSPPLSPAKGLFAVLPPEAPGLSDRWAPRRGAMTPPAGCGNQGLIPGAPGPAGKWPCARHRGPGAARRTPRAAPALPSFRRRFLSSCLCVRVPRPPHRPAPRLLAAASLHHLQVCRCHACGAVCWWHVGCSLLQPSASSVWHRQALPTAGRPAPGPGSLGTPLPCVSRLPVRLRARVQPPAPPCPGEGGRCLVTSLLGTGGARLPRPSPPTAASRPGLVTGRGSCRLPRQPSRTRPVGRAWPGAPCSQGCVLTSFR